MTKISRIEMLQSFAEEEPGNPFNWYALALEFKSDFSKGSMYFDKLLNEHKSYLPTYYHAAAFYTEMGELDKAKQIFEDGIALAKTQKESHALRELNNSYMNFLFENDLD